MYKDQSLISWLDRRPKLSGIHRSIREPGKEAFYLDSKQDAVIFHDYPGDMWLRDEHFSLLTGHISFVPCGVKRVFRSSARGQHRVLNFESSPFFLQAVFSAGVFAPSFHTRFDEALRFYSLAPLRAEVKCWELLYQAWENFETSQDHTLGKYSRLVHSALQEIELRFSEPFSAESLADDLGVSLSHLSRQFSKEVGQPLIHWVTNRRMLLAQKLLRQTTLPIKEVAYACGLPDAQWFNKTVRKELGKSPTEIRQLG